MFKCKYLLANIAVKYCLTKIAKDIVVQCNLVLIALRQFKIVNTSISITEIYNPPLSSQ